MLVREDRVSCCHDREAKHPSGCWHLKQAVVLVNMQAHSKQCTTCRTRSCWNRTIGQFLKYTSTGRLRQAVSQDEVAVGVPARRQAAANPHNTYSSVKRIIGRPFSAVQAELRTLPYAVVRSFDGSAELWCPAQCAVNFAENACMCFDDGGKSASRAGII